MYIYLKYFNKIIAFEFHMILTGDAHNSHFLEIKLYITIKNLNIFEYNY